VQAEEEFFGYNQNTINMKVLIIFCDMLRANLLETFKPETNSGQPMDDWFYRIGGTAFTNCYTPSPDTARSLACFYTGLYPKKNGCNHRIMWPEHFLDEKNKTIFDIFLDKSFSIVSYIDKRKSDIGFFPKRNKDSMNLYHKLDDALSSPELESENLLFFAALDDCHFAIDDHGQNEKAHFIGQKHLSNSFEKIFNKFDKDDFDSIVIFSDHGCKLGFKENYKEKPIDKLNSDRTQIVMHVRSKGEHSVIQNNKLSSIMDVFPFFCDKLNFVPNQLDGISFFSNIQHKEIVIEDCSSFSPTLYNSYDIWSVRTPTHLYCLDFETKTLDKIENKKYKKLDINKNKDIILTLEKKLIENSCQYANMIKIKKIMKGYKLLKSSRDKYSDEQNRITGLKKRLAPLFNNPTLFFHIPFLLLKRFFS